MAAILEWVKMHRKFATSSIMECSVASRYFFQLAIIVSDSVGVLIGTIPALSRQFNMPEDLVRVCLDELGQPDPSSSHIDHEGRRIIRTGENEYLVTTKMEHNPDATNAERQARYRAKRKEKLDAAVRLRDGNDVTAGNDGCNEVTVRVEESREENITTTLAKPGGLPKSGNGFDQFWMAYPKKVKRGRALAIWTSLTADERKLATGAVQVYAKAWATAPTDRRQYIPHGERWLKAKRWTDDPAEWPREANPDAHPAADSSLTPEDEAAFRKLEKP